jgi:hypothetical protein
MRARPSEPVSIHGTRESAERAMQALAIARDCMPDSVHRDEIIGLLVQIRYALDDAANNGWTGEPHT